MKQSKNWLSSKNIKNLAKYEKPIKNLVKFKTSRELRFLSSIYRLAYTQLR